MWALKGHQEKGNSESTGVPRSFFLFFSSHERQFSFSPSRPKITFSSPGSLTSETPKTIINIFKQWVAIKGDGHSVEEVGSGPSNAISLAIRRLPNPPRKGLEDMLQHLPTSLSRCCMTIVHILQEGVAPTCWPGGGSKVSPSFGLLDVVKILNSTYRKKTLSNMSSKTRHHQERYLLQSLFQFQVF